MPMLVGHLIQSQIGDTLVVLEVSEVFSCCKIAPSPRRFVTKSARFTHNWSFEIILNCQAQVWVSMGKIISSTIYKFLKSSPTIVVAAILFVTVAIMQWKSLRQSFYLLGRRIIFSTDCWVRFQYSLGVIIRRLGPKFLYTVGWSQCSLRPLKQQRPL